MQRINAVQDIIKRLRVIYTETTQEAADIKKKALQYDMLHDLTPKQEDEADALYNRQEEIDEQLDIIDTAISTLLCFKP